MIIELFGLSNTGKSVLKEKLAQQDYDVSTTRFDKKIGRTARTLEAAAAYKILFFIKYFLTHPFDTLYLFYKLNTNYIGFKGSSIYKYFKILLMRNKYLISVLSKSEQIKNKEDNIFVDEFSHQAIFMIMQNKSSERELKKIIDKLPKSDYILLFEQSKERRYKAYRKPHPFKTGANHFPGSWIDKNYAKEWMIKMEHNFEIIKEIIEERAKKDEEFFQSLKLNLPEDYLKNIKITAYKLL